ncbi:hypothetical protein [Undibacterium sp. Di24W]|uniref:hypothetical protein n=1 Tax=Undibacterium sp. Di24W TaxID=3413033 RepID=UPI003BF15D35
MLSLEKQRYYPSREQTRIPITRQAYGKSMHKRKDDLKYWRELWKKARTLRVDISGENWCNHWHQHFDWDSRGEQSRLEHRKHIRPLMRAFSKVRNELTKQEEPFQIFVSINPSDPGSDALYVHTPNPHTDFPLVFEDLTFITTLPPLLLGLVCLKNYQVGVSGYDNEKQFTILKK